MSAPRPTRSRLLVAAIAAGAAAGLAALGVAGAGAQGVGELNDRIAAARAEAQRLGASIEARENRIAALAERVNAALDRERRLSAELFAGAERSRELGERLEVERAELAAVQSRLGRARGRLAARLVEIYKGSEPDYLSVVLSSRGFEDLTTRAEYLKAVQEQDARLAERVGALAAEAAGQHDEVAAVKADADQHARRIDAARDQIVAVRAERQRQLARLEAERRAERAALAELRAKIDRWVAEVGRREVANWFGPYAIPYSIVMCESGGNYRAYNPSSGAGGAYQILPSTWRAYGGKGMPHRASKREQDRIAARIWADSGPSAWVCAQ